MLGHMGDVVFVQYSVNLDIVRVDASVVFISKGGGSGQKFRYVVLPALLKW